MSRMPSVIVMGGSLGGLTAALVLRDAGCDVRVFERSSAALQARRPLADRYLAHMRQLLEQNDQWDPATVIVMGDHSLPKTRSSGQHPLQCSPPPRR